MTFLFRIARFLQKCLSFNACGHIEKMFDNYCKVCQFTATNILNTYHMTFYPISSCDWRTTTRITRSSSVLSAPCLTVFNVCTYFTIAYFGNHGRRQNELKVTVLIGQ